MVSEGVVQPRLMVIPCHLRQANAYVAAFHRHHGRVVGHYYSLAVIDSTGLVRGVAIVGRPVTRGAAAAGLTAEVSRVATDGCPNACSALYGAAWRVARAMGYRRLITYVLDNEPGTSLRAAGWRFAAAVKGKSWSTSSRPRIDHYPIGDKQRWEITVAPTSGPVLPATVNWGVLAPTSEQLAFPE